MNIEELREYCLKKPFAEESFPFGNETLVFKVADKIFLLAGLDNSPLQFNVKCDPDKAIELRGNYICVMPGYHMNKKHWNTIVCDGSAPKKIIFGWVDDSYDLVMGSLSKSVRAKMK